MKNSGKKVLVIEDDSWFAEHHLRTLNDAGFTVQHASDGLAGMEMIDAFCPDVVVLDIFLPGPNALTLLHEIQSHSDLRALPVIICSTTSATIPPGSLKAYGVTSVLDKGSMRPSDLIASIKRVVS